MSEGLSALKDMLVNRLHTGYASWTPVLAREFEIPYETVSTALDELVAEGRLVREDVPPEETFRDCETGKLEAGYYRTPSLLDMLQGASVGQDIKHALKKVYKLFSECYAKIFK